METQKVSASFLKKRRPARGSKKLSFTAGLGALLPTPAGPKVFWLLFFKKVTPSLPEFINSMGA
jgi:hypothetical protein